MSPRNLLAAWTNPATPRAEPVIVEGDCVERMVLLPDACMDLILTSPPYPRAQRKPEDLGWYRRFLEEDGSVRREASDVPRVRDAAKKLAAQHPNGEPSQRDRAAFRSQRRDSLLKREAADPAIRHAPRARLELKKAKGKYEGDNRPNCVTQWLHGKPNLRGQTGLQVQIHPDHWWSWFEPAAAEMKRVLKPRRALLLNLGGVICPTWNHHTYDWDLPSRMKALGWQFIRPIYWVKPNGPPCTAEGMMTNVVEHVYWFAHGVTDDAGPIWFPWEVSSHGPDKVKRPIVRNVVTFAVGQTKWPQETGRWNRVPLGAVSCGMKHRVSADCPVHGDSVALVSIPRRGQLASDGSSCTGRNDDHHDPKQASGSGNTAQTCSEESQPYIEDSLHRMYGSSAKPRSSGTRRRGRAPETTSPCISSVETESRSSGRSESPESRSPHSGTHGYRTSPEDATAFRASGRTAYRTVDKSSLPIPSECICEFYQETTENSTHFACYPLQLADYFIRGWSQGAKTAGGMFPEHVIEPDLVLDPFLGSGTTGLAAWQLGRRWIGLELNPEGEIRCAQQRFAQEFGKEPA